jgi:hypothetical protein
MKSGFLERYREAHSVVKVAKVLGVLRGGYHAWGSRAQSEPAFVKIVPAGTSLTLRSVAAVCCSHQHSTWLRAFHDPCQQSHEPRSCLQDTAARRV